MSNKLSQRIQFDRERVLRAYEYWGGPAKIFRIARFVNVHPSRATIFVEEAVERGVLVPASRDRYVWPGTVKVQLVLDALQDEVWVQPPRVQTPPSSQRGKKKRWAYIEDLNGERRIRENLGWVFECDYCHEPVPTGKEYVLDGTTRICFRHWTSDDVTTVLDPTRQVPNDQPFKLKSGGNATCYFCEEEIKKGVDFYLPWTRVRGLGVSIKGNISGKKICHGCGKALLEGAIPSTS